MMLGVAFNPIISGAISGAPRPISSVRIPRREASKARLVAIVVLPEPPHWFQTVMIRSPVVAVAASRF